MLDKCLLSDIILYEVFQTTVNSEPPDITMTTHPWKKWPAPKGIATTVAKPLVLKKRVKTVILPDVETTDAADYVYVHLALNAEELQMTKISDRAAETAVTA